jgi:hypothetical protein
LEENKLPVIDVRIDNINTIKLLRKSKLIRYVEPMGYEPENFDANLQNQVRETLAGSTVVAVIQVPPIYRRR